MAHSRPGELSSKAGALEDIPNPLAGLWQGWDRGLFEGVYQVDTCICLMYIFLEVYCLSVQVASLAPLQSRATSTPSGTPSLILVPVYVKRPLHTAQPAHTVAHTGTLHASARPVAYTFAPARLRAAGGSEPRHPLLEGGDAVLDVRRVGEDDGGHDGSEVVGQVVVQL